MRLAPAIGRELQEAEVRRARRQAREALRESEERFRQLAENIDAAFFMTNVTNEEFPVNVAGNRQSGGYDAYVTNVPRMWGFRLKYRFSN